jgi:hypothetical protein
LARPLFSCRDLRLSFTLVATMFDERQNRNWNWSWTGIIIAVLAVLAVIQILRVNPPRSSISAEDIKPIWTEGTIVSGVIEVPATGFLSFPLNFNRRVTLKGNFTTGSSDKRLACTIISVGELEKWKAGNGVTPITNTSPVPRGLIRRVIEPGSYVLIFDNRMNSQDMRLIESDFSVD